jgi:hypothetical protein
MVDLTLSNPPRLAAGLPKPYQAVGHQGLSALSPH